MTFQSKADMLYGATGSSNLSQVILCVLVWEHISVEEKENSLQLQLENVDW